MTLSPEQLIKVYEYFSGHTFADLITAVVKSMRENMPPKIKRHYRRYTRAYARNIHHK